MAEKVRNKTHKNKIQSNKNQTTKEVKQKTFNKKLRLIISIIVIVCIIGVAWFVFISDYAKAEKPKAQLIIESGTVQIKHMEESWINAEDGMYLYESDSIKTGDNSYASIIFFQSSIIRLDSNTEVTIKKLLNDIEKTSVTIQQDSGRTWNTISRISGIDDYNVETPTAVASVRGTSFNIDVDEEGISVVKVIKGIVNVTYSISGTVYTVQLNDTYSITVGYNETGEPQPFELDDWIINNLLNDELFKEDLKNILYERIQPYIDYLKEEIGMSDQEIDALLNGYIEEEYDIPPETPDEYKKLFDLS